jgi:three-Cys-motif partner protein
MTKWNGKIIFLDGFAGPGEYKNGELGSPIIAIDTFLNHSYEQIRDKEVMFIFIEQDEKRCEHLNQLLLRRKNDHRFPEKASYQVLQGNFNETMDQVLTELEKRQLSLAPTFAFIDPFGYSHTPMKTIKRLMSHKGCEVLINFMYEEINRFLTADYTNKAEQYDALFGSSDWKKIAQDTSNVKKTKETAKERMISLHDLYQEQLKTIAGARYVRSFRMKNKHNATDYFLFFATNSLRGMDKMKCSMCKVDPSGSYEFSDFTNPHQLMLFKPEPDYTLLQKMLRENFKNKIVDIKTIESYIIADTPFCTSGYRTYALKPMEKAKPAQIEVISSGPNRKFGQYPDKDPSLRIKFL